MRNQKIWLNISVEQRIEWLEAIGRNFYDPKDVLSECIRSGYSTKMSVDSPEMLLNLLKSLQNEKFKNDYSLTWEFIGKELYHACHFFTFNNEELKQFNDIIYFVENVFDNASAGDWQVKYLNFEGEQSPDFRQVITVLPDGSTMTLATVHRNGGVMITDEHQKELMLNAFAMAASKDMYQAIRDVLNSNANLPDDVMVSLNKAFRKANGDSFI